MPRLQNELSFADSFMRGYSFVDDINRRNRNEARLEDRLAEEREQRKFERQQAEARGTRQAQSHAVELADREARIARENREREARAAIARGEDAAGFADTQFGAAELMRQGREDELVAAGRNLAELGQTRQQQSLSAQAARAASAGGTQAPPDPLAAPAAAPAEGTSQLGGSRGRDATETVEFEDLSPFDEEFQSMGIPGKVSDAIFARPGRNISEAVRGLSVGAANVVNSARGALPVESGASTGAGLTGTLAVPEEFVTEEEFATMTDSADVERARLSNERVVRELKQRAQDPSSSRVQRLSEGSREVTAEARQAEAQVTQRYSQFLDPNQESSLRQLTSEEPDVAATQYFRDRATLNSADPNLRAAIDRQMQPVISEYEQTIQAEIAEAPVGSPEQRRHVTRLRNVQATASQIYTDYKPSAAAGINNRGMPVGNQELAGRVSEEIDSPDRPRPTTPQPPRQISSAETTVGRIRENTRLNDTQIRSVVRLRDAGLMTPGDAQSLLLTGRLPQSSIAVKFREFDGDLFATDSLGNIKLVKSGTAKRKGNEVSPNQITSRALDDVDIGLRAVMPNADDSYFAAARNLMLNNSDYLQQRFDLRNQQSNIELGRVLGQSLFLNAAENNRRDNNWIPFDGFFEGPSAQEILESPEIRNELAGRFDIQLQNIPDIRETGIPASFDAGAARSFLQSGDLGQRQQAIGDEGSDADVYLEILRLSELTPGE